MSDTESSASAVIESAIDSSPVPVVGMDNIDSLLEQARKAVDSAPVDSATLEGESTESNDQKSVEPVEESAPSSDDALKSAEDGDEADTKPLSRRRAAEFARIAREEAETATRNAMAERERADQATAALAAREKADEELFADVMKALGTDEAFDADLAKALEGDYESSERVKAYKSNRDLYNKIYRVVELRQQANLQGQYLESKSLEGVDGSVIDNATSISTAMKHVYEAAANATKASYEAQIERLKADYEGKLAKSASKIRTPDAGGVSTGGAAARPSWVGADGLPTDQALADIASGRKKLSDFV